MQELSDLLDSKAGLDYLKSEGVFVSQQHFKDQLQAPAKNDLTEDLGGEDAKLVCSGQQVYIDYRQSVLSKFEALRDIAQVDDLLSLFLWVDTDRSGADSLTTKFAWPNGRKKGPITILPPGTREVETRFSAIDSSVLVGAADQLWTSLRQSDERVDGAKERYKNFRSIFVDSEHTSLSAFNLQVSEFLLSNVYDYVPRSVSLSALLGRTTILQDVDIFVNCIVDVIKVFNEAVGSLIGNNINPQVKPLLQAYLPLFYSCDDDGRRLRLFRQIEGSDHFALGRCKCGRQFKFHLGQGQLSIAELALTNRWSPDVCFPVFINDLVSGFVAGKSSTLYLIVMNAVLRKVLGKTPVPILIPQYLEYQNTNNGQFDSLLYRYLAGIDR